MFGTSWTCRRCLLRSFHKHSRKRLHGISRFQSTVTTVSRQNAAISQSLLARARSLTKEHIDLSAQLTKSFDSKTAKRIGELQPIATALQQWDNAQSSLAELQALLSDPTTDAELRDLAADDLNSTTSQLHTLSLDLTRALTPKHPFADLPCLLEIKPGVGGGEANLFAADLLKMYRAYCSRQGLRATLMKYESADGETDSKGEAPLQEAILEVENPGAYGELRSEAGVHRVQRVPATESKGRTHTSAVSVIVLPSLSSGGEESLTQADLNDPESDYYVNPTEVRTDVMRASGAGGQHVNKTDSAVRLTHIPTGTVVSMQESRSQHKNREKAWSILRSRLAQARREAREEEVQRVRRSVAGVAKMGRGDKVRTYNWGQQRVTDHRSGLSVHNLNDVMEGGEELGKIIESVKSWLADRDIEDLIAEEQAAGKEGK